MSDALPPSAPVILISHSHADTALAALLADLFRQAYQLRAHEVRCSSVAEHAPRAGEDFASELRKEIAECQLFVWLVTTTSLTAPWVLMEVGARWASARALTPVIAGAVPEDARYGPIASLHRLRLNDQTHTLKLIEETGRLIGRPPDVPAALTAPVTTLVAAASRLAAEPQRVAADQSVARLRRRIGRGLLAVSVLTLVGLAAGIVGDYFDVGRRALPPRVDFYEEPSLSWELREQMLTLTFWFTARSDRTSTQRLISVDGWLGQNDGAAPRLAVYSRNEFQCAIDHEQFSTFKDIRIPAKTESVRIDCHVAQHTGGFDQQALRQAGRVEFFVVFRNEVGSEVRIRRCAQGEYLWKSIFADSRGSGEFGNIPC